MTLYIWLVFVYEILGNIQTEFARRAIASPVYSLSTLERRLWKDSSLVSLSAMAFLFVVRINGIAFLIYLGFKTAWWHPVALWVGCLVASGVATSMFRGKTGLAIPSMFAFILMPVIAITLWSTV